MLKRLLFTIIILTPCYTTVRSEIIILKSGERIEGKITNQSRTQVEILKQDGSKIIIDKDKIQRIQFGQTQQEIEEERRKKEEEEKRKKAEEDKRRLEEQRRRKEEEVKKRIEEERRKEDEKKLIQIRKEPIEKRHGLEVGYGEGPSYIVPSLFKLYDLFFYMFTTGQFFFGSSNINKNSISYNYGSYNNQIYLRYLKDNIEIGYSIALFELNTKNFKNIYKLESRNVLFVPGYNKLSSDSEYSISQLWFIYNIMDFSIFNYKAILGIQSNIYGVNTILQQNINYFKSNLTEISSQDIKTNENQFLSIGPNISIKIKSDSEFILSALISKGKMKPEFNYYTINLSNFGISSFNYISLKFTENIGSTGIYYKIGWNYEIYKQYRLFIEYLYNENQYKLENITANVFDSSPGPNSPPPILPPFIIDIFTIGQKRIAIEKNQYLNIGISYRFNFK